MHAICRPDQGRVEFILLEFRNNLDSNKAKRPTVQSGLRIHLLQDIAEAIPVTAIRVMREIDSVFSEYLKKNRMTPPQKVLVCDACSNNQEVGYFHLTEGLHQAIPENPFCSLQEEPHTIETALARTLNCMPHNSKLKEIFYDRLSETQHGRSAGKFV